MIRTSRRNFLRHSGAVAAASVLPPLRLPGAESQNNIEVILEESLGEISPDLYGYLLENIGTAIYDGIWVGERSKVENVSGIRKAVIDRMRDLKASLIRWPGGSFADFYDWQDGIGPKAKRPRRTNMWTESIPPDAPQGPQRYDPNLFGTPEFMHLCRLSGGRPFLNVNVRSLTAQSFNRWVEYCNSPPHSTTLADARATDGSASDRSSLDRRTPGRRRRSRDRRRLPSLRPTPCRQRSLPDR